MSLQENEPPTYARHRAGFQPVTLPMHSHPLVKKLFAEINQQQTSVSAVADRSGVSRVTIDKWRRHNMPLVANLDAVLNALGLELFIREKSKA